MIDFSCRQLVNSRFVLRWVEGWCLRAALATKVYFSVKPNGLLANQCPNLFDSIHLFGTDSFYRRLVANEPRCGNGSHLFEFKLFSAIPLFAFSQPRNCQVYFRGAYIQHSSRLLLLLLSISVLSSIAPSSHSSAVFIATLDDYWNRCGRTAVRSPRFRAVKRAFEQSIFELLPRPSRRRRSVATNCRTAVTIGRRCVRLAHLKLTCRNQRLVATGLRLILCNCLVFGLTLHYSRILRTTPIHLHYYFPTQLDKDWQMLNGEWRSFFYRKDYTCWHVWINSIIHHLQWLLFH